MIYSNKNFHKYWGNHFLHHNFKEFLDVLIDKRVTFKTLPFFVHSLINNKLLIRYNMILVENI